MDRNSNDNVAAPQKIELKISFVKKKNKNQYLVTKLYINKKYCKKYYKNITECM